jgi:hypothetical protein
MNRPWQTGEPDPPRFSDKLGDEVADEVGDGDQVDSAPGAGFEAGGEAPVNYEEAALLELEIEGTDYRLDVGRAGTALCISTRPSGSWSWVFRGEAKWQTGVLRCKAFDRQVLSQLSTALAEAASSAQS